MLSNENLWVLRTPDSIPSHAQYATAAKVFLTSKFSYLLFCNPTHNTQTEIANRWQTTDHIYYTVLSQVHSFTAFHQPQQQTVERRQTAEQNYFPEPKRACSDFLRPTFFNVHGSCT